jgi:hypothetical protein
MLVDCEICKCKKQGHKSWIEGKTVHRVCELCSFFRFGLTKKELIAHARKVSKNRQNPRTAPYKNFVVDKDVFNKRRASIQRSDKRHGCDTSKTMSQRDLYTFVRNNPCYYCGGKATGIDRQGWEVCYMKKHLKNPEKMVASCVLCNAMKRERPRNVFVGKMNRIAKNNP